MRTAGFIFLFPFSALALGLTACAESPGSSSSEQDDPGLLSVYVVNYPLQYFAERIGGNRIAVAFPAPPGVDPSDWMPDDETILRYQQADLVLLNGAGYERWARRASLPAATQVDTARTIQDRLLIVPDAITHSHGPDGVHSHPGTAFTTWLDPLLAVEHARVVKDSLARRLPAHADEFAGRFEALADDLRGIDREIEKIVRDHRERPLLASHPVYHYLETRYELSLVNLSWYSTRMPGAEEWEKLEAILNDHPAGAILWKADPLPAIQSRLEALGVKSIVYSPAAQPPSDGDFLAMMRQNAANLRTAFAE